MDTFASRGYDHAIDGTLGTKGVRFDPTGELERIFRGPEIAARVPPVPAIEVTRDEWDKIRAMIGCLVTIHDGICPRAIGTALVSGKAIEEAVEYAVSLQRFTVEGK